MHIVGMRLIASDALEHRGGAADGLLDPGDGSGVKPTSRSPRSSEQRPESPAGSIKSAKTRTSATPRSVRRPGTVARRPASANGAMMAPSEAAILPLRPTVLGLRVSATFGSTSAKTRKRWRPKWPPGRADGDTVLAVPCALLCMCVGMHACAGLWMDVRMRACK